MRAVRAVEPADAQPQLGVFAHRRPGEQAVILDDQPGVRARARHRLPFHQHPPGCRQQQPGEQGEQGALAAARRPQHGPGFAAPHLPVITGEDGRGVRVAEGQVWMEIMIE